MFLIKNMHIMTHSNIQIIRIREVRMFRIRMSFFLLRDLYNNNSNFLSTFRMFQAKYLWQQDIYFHFEMDFVKEGWCQFFSEISFYFQGNFLAFRYFSPLIFDRILFFLEIFLFFLKLLNQLLWRSFWKYGL